MNGFVSKVVGVTFEGRQKTLQELRNDSTWRELTLIHTIYHNPETGVDEPAIQVIDFNTKRDCGWIARTDLAKYDNVHQMTGEFGNYKDMEYINLYTPKMPSNKQYWAVRKICENRNLKMPIYDVRAYEGVFAYEKAFEIQNKIQPITTE